MNTTNKCTLKSVNYQKSGGECLQFEWDANVYTIWRTPGIQQTVPFYYITIIRINRRVESLLQGLLQGEVKDSLEVVKEKVDVQEDRCPTKQLSQNKDHNTQWGWEALSGCALWGFLVVHWFSSTCQSFNSMPTPYLQRGGTHRQLLSFHKTPWWE